MKAGKIIMKNIKGSDGNACNRIKGGEIFSEGVSTGSRGEIGVVFHNCIRNIFYDAWGEITAN